ncbi:hypothetical protein [Providencia sp. PROV140]|uniref:hypothetical protein n=1 Tax=Providencia sp. PROV140 TaxID=2949850 RepID=UPI0023491C58|nr:hypothetical protein [Providencia sp. PROV140]
MTIQPKKPRAKPAKERLDNLINASSELKSWYENSVKYYVEKQNIYIVNKVTI